MLPNLSGAPTPACPAFAEAASRRQAKRPHFGVQARRMKIDLFIGKGIGYEARFVQGQKVTPNS
jgi:hypothetical protein